MAPKSKAKSKPQARGAGKSKKPLARKPAAPAAKGHKPTVAKKPAVAPKKPAAPVKGHEPKHTPGATPGTKPGAPPPAEARPKPQDAKPVVAKPPRPGGSRKSSRRPGSGLRRGSDGELFKPGEVLLPGGPQTAEEIVYLFRGCAAAERPALEHGVNEVLQRVPKGDAPARDPEAVRHELQRFLDAAAQRFDSGRIEAALPGRANVSRRGFPDVVERARGRRRELGAFLRGLDLGRTETSHMDSHGEASLQSLMEWAARLENLADADEPDQADYAQFHRGLDQLETTTEALIIDVAQTLRRLRDRTRAS